MHSTPMVGSSNTLFQKYIEKSREGFAKIP